MDNKRAKDDDKKVISFIPNGEFYYKKAMLAMEKDNLPDAHKYLKRATELSPDDPLVLMQYGVLLMEEGNFHEAHKLLTSAYSLSPDATETVFYLAEVHAHLGLLRDAKFYAEKYIALNPEGPFGDESMEIIDFAEQQESIREEEEDQDEEAYYLQEKARHLMETGKFNEAVDLLESIITDYPDFWAAYNNLALAYFYIGETEQASALLREVLANNKGNLHALCNLAIFYYYEEKDGELRSLLALLMKIKPYLMEHRYKLGATFALIGRHEEAFNWLISLQKHGFEGDAGFYYWLSHSAFFTGHEAIARSAFARLLEIDPTKEGHEPWLDIEGEIEPSSVEHDRDFLLGKINHTYRSERMFGFYLLGKSGHQQEIISHPSYIKVEELSLLEKLFLASGLRYQMVAKTEFDKIFERALETTDLLYEQYRPLNYEAAHLFQMWFTICESGLSREYRFLNPAALAAAADYMFQSARYSGVTKKSIADKYGVSVPTLTKYVNELVAFLPHLDG